jgi:hypothetical protein
VTSGPPSADWYPDPGGSGRERYWDGERWTKQLRPGPQLAAMPQQRAWPPASTGRSTVRLWWFLAAAFAVPIVITIAVVIHGLRTGATSATSAPTQTVQPTETQSPSTSRAPQVDTTSQSYRDGYAMAKVAMDDTGLDATAHHPWQVLGGVVTNPYDTGSWPTVEAFCTKFALDGATLSGIQVTNPDDFVNGCAAEIWDKYHD